MQVESTMTGQGMLQGLEFQSVNGYVKTIEKEMKTMAFKFNLLQIYI